MQRVLIIDDNKLLRAMGSSMLTKNDYEVLTAESGIEGLKALSENEVDVVLLDIILNNESGMDLIPKIRKTSPKTKIIMLTSYSDEETVREAKKLGACDFIEKPLSMENLLFCLKHAVPS